MTHSTEPHLSPATLDALLVEPHAAALAEARAHCETCPVCQAAFLAVQAPLRDLRLEAHRAAEHAMRRLAMRPPTVAPSSRLLWTLRRPAPLAGLLAGAAAAVAGVALLLTPHPGHRSVETTAAQHAPTSAAASPGTTAADDEALLTGIDSDLSRSVAGPLQPLSDPTPNRSHSSAAQN